MNSGGSVNLISSRTARALEAPRLHNSASIIKGVSGDIHSPFQVRLSLQSVYDHESIPIKACVADTIPATHSSASMREIKHQSFLSNLKLADPDYTPAARIDVLLTIVMLTIASRQELQFLQTKMYMLKIAYLDGQ